MIDGGVFLKMNPSYEGMFSENRYAYQASGFQRNYKKFTVKKFPVLVPEQYFLCDSFVFGFSFKTKRWGEFKVDQIEDIQFVESAFDRLVLERKKKRLIRCFVTNNKKAASDIIQNKGGGCIILLHGPPGTGKTLTAESIAEMLHKPLYSCSVGELGTSARELERSLADILEMCKLWEAVLLIDEADIFLEQRSKNDIQRNAMVGIFLRLLG